MTSANNQVTAIVLGIMQDGALPHIGCRCRRCTEAFANPGKMEYAACLALVDRRREQPGVWLIDATPDIKWQLNLLAKLLGDHPQRPERIRQPDGIFLTHAHMGHIGGLQQLGPEAMAVQELPIFATADLISLLQANSLWQPLRSCLVMNPFTIGKPLILAPDVQITPLAVPHRDESGVGTVAFEIRGPERSLLYLPDIDAWDEWPEGAAMLAAVDIALVDASFYSKSELGGRLPAAHPLVPDTLRRFANIPGRLVLTHINHTNPILDEGSQEWEHVQASGAAVAECGLAFQL